MIYKYLPLSLVLTLAPTPESELQKLADRADQLVLFFLAGANFWEKHAKNRRKHAKTGENTQKQAKNRRFFGANFFGGKLVGANFYAFCNYAPNHHHHHLLH